MLKFLIGAGTGLVLTIGSAFAHVSLEGAEAAVGSSYKAVFRVPHGCEGKPTIAVRVQIPEGVIGVKPMPKPGWTLEKITGDYEKTYELHGTPISEGVTEIVWKGGSLADDEYDKFVLRGTLTTDLPVGTMLHFPIVQECSGGAFARWIEIPAEGQAEDELEHPAPGVLLIETAGGH
jgi:periplasmic copper chaperone A